MYHSDRSVKVTESSLSDRLCGAARPGHFDGVCTVVLKLFLLTDCDAAVFGEKDFQQLAIIRRMVRDLSSHVEIISIPTIRESDGLAMSSRNVRLSPEQRIDAPRIRTALLAGAIQPTAELVLATARAHIEATALTRIDYLTLVDAVTFQETNHLITASILATAVFYDSVRLIDHVKVGAR
jgi:pantoate--beta-alanine ligase